MDGGTDREIDMTKQIVAFRNFAKTPKTNQLIEHREVIDVYSDIHIKNINTPCGGTSSL
jgi:hypothetical protein